MSERNLDYTALESHLQSLRYLFIDITRLQMDDKYDEKEGGYGDVRFSILDSEINGGRRVAIKTLRLKNKHKQHGRIAFSLVRELKVWANLQHPNILPLLGYYLNDGLTEAILISEYMVHGDLGEYVIDAMKGLHYLHTREPPICHADIKKNNVLVNRHRRGLLSDFGLSKALDESPSGLTTSTELRGTPWFWSPELITEINPQYTLASDIWAWACLLLQVLTGKSPYEGVIGHVGIYTKLISGEVPANIDEISIQVPGIKRLLADCWAIEPGSRPSALDCLCYISSTLSTFSHSDGNFEAEIRQLGFDLGGAGYRSGNEPRGDNPKSTSTYSAEPRHDSSIATTHSLPSINLRKDKEALEAQVVASSGIHLRENHRPSSPSYSFQGQFPPAAHQLIAQTVGAVSNPLGTSSRANTTSPQSPWYTMDPFVRAHPPRPPAWPTLAPTMDIVDSDDLNGLDPVFANPTLIHHPDRRRDHPLVLSRAASQQETAFWGDSHRTNVQRAPFFMQSEALQHQNQNQIHNPLLQITALRLAGITPQQFANMAPRQQEQLRQILESQLQQQALTQAYAQTRHLFQQEQPLPRLPQQHQGQLQFDSGQEQQRQSLRAQMLDFGPVRQWNGAGGNGGGDGGPVEALQNQNQNQNPNPLLQTAAPRLTGITPQQFANISAQQREQLRQFLETQQQQQQQALAQAQAQHQLQQQQQQQQRQQINQQPQLGQPDRPMQYHEFFTTTFNNWLAQRQLTLEPPRVDGKEVELHKLFLMVGALGGCRAVFEKRSWPLVGAKIGYPYFNGSMPYSKSEVGDQLSKVYQRLLADFEVHWHNSLRPRDPTSVFPLPPQLQYLHPEIERLAAATVPLPPLPVQQEKMQLQARL